MAARLVVAAVLAVLAGLVVQLGPAPGGVAAFDVRARHENYLPDYAAYHNLSRVYARLRDEAARHPDLITLLWDYQSSQGRPIPVVQFTPPAAQQRGKAAVARLLLSFGEHAREFVTVESMFELLGWLTGSSGSSTRHAALRQYLLQGDVDLLIVPILNPDGRAHVEETGNYCWRGLSNGVDPNRNYDWNFAGPGSSSNPHDEEYRGSAAFSEPETRVLRDLARPRLDGFLSVHSGIREIYVPFADSTRSSVAQTEPEMLVIAARMAQSARGFTSGRARELNTYAADGTSFDYMAGTAKVPVSLAVEVWGKGDLPGLQCFDLFNPRSENLRAATEAILPLYLTFIEGVLAHRRVFQPPTPMGLIPSSFRTWMLLAAAAAAALWLSTRGWRRGHLVRLRRL